MSEFDEISEDLERVKKEELLLLESVVERFKNPYTLTNFEARKSLRDDVDSLYRFLPELTSGEYGEIPKKAREYILYLKEKIIPELYRRTKRKSLKELLFD